jgi:hypothetical protein
MTLFVCPDVTRQSFSGIIDQSLLRLTCMESRFYMSPVAEPFYRHRICFQSPRSTAGFRI